jgi:TfoX/Sxy family transcriptional regulator of competence genes
VKFPKASEWIKQLFVSLVEELDCEKRQMFGYPCAFVNGRMFSGVFGDSIMVRLAEGDRAELLAVPGATVPDPMGGRPMKEYVQFPDSLLEDEDALAAWLKRGFGYVKTLPPNVKKPKGAKKQSAKKPAPKAGKKR